MTATDIQIEQAYASFRDQVVRSISSSRAILSEFAEGLTDDSTPSHRVRWSEPIFAAAATFDLATDVGLVALGAVGSCQ